ncbi:MAG TPA: hypothetical protein VKF41_00730 [Bryobacteraceae bacterium]|nr:hypothetical protein [Bryobacteraceae bacterium]
MTIRSLYLRAGAMALVVCPVLMAASQKTVDRDSIPQPVAWPPKPAGSDALPPRQAWVNAKAATLNQEHVVDLLGITAGNCRGYGPNDPVQRVHRCGKDAYGPDGKIIPGKTEVANFPGPDDYLVIHVLSWKDPAAGAKTQDVDKENWYVYNNGRKWDDAAYGTNNRIFGRKSVYLLYLHFNRGADLDYHMRDELVATSKTPAFLDHLVSLGQIWGIGAAGAGGPSSTATDVWGMVSFPIDYVPSDLSFAPMVLDAADGHVVSSLTAKKFDNEGKYHTDFSVAVPITKISDFKYTDTAGTLAPAKYDKQRMLAAFDYHPWAFDVKGTGFDIHPYLMTGVGLGSQPLQRALFAVGWGPAYANFYAGALLNTRHVAPGVACGKNPPATSPAGTTVGTQSCVQFTFGINVGAGAVVTALKGNASSTASTASSKPATK